MLIVIAIAEAIRVFIEHIPTLGLLLGAPIAIITLGFIATAVATFIDQQLPAGKAKEPSFSQEPFRR